MSRYFKSFKLKPENDNIIIRVMKGMLLVGESIRKEGKKLFRPFNGRFLVNGHL